jgi:hypothetical protein
VRGVRSPAAFGLPPIQCPNSHDSNGHLSPPPVLVANRTIQAGTPSTIVAERGVYVATTLPKMEVAEDAIADPAYLVGRAATAKSFPDSSSPATSSNPDRRRNLGVEAFR